MWTQIRLLLQQQSDLGPLCLTKRRLKLKKTTFVVVGALSGICAPSLENPEFYACEQQMFSLVSVIIIYYLKIFIG